MARRMARRIIPINFNVPITDLPGEILLRIFEKFVDLHSSSIIDWYHITHVCKLWRQLVIETGAFWTIIPTETNVNWTLLALKRSKSLPIESIDLHSTDWEMNLAVIPHISRVRNLVIQMSKSALSHVGHMLACVGGYAPLLESVEIRGDSTKSPFSLSAHLLSAHICATEALHRVCIQSVGIDWATSLLRQNLTTLILVLEDIPLGSAPTWDKLLGALRSMPSLIHLTLRQAFPLTVNISDTNTVALPDLEDLEIYCNKAFQAQSFLSHVGFPALESFYLGCDAGDDGQSSYSGVLREVRRTATFASILSSEAPLLAIEVDSEPPTVMKNLAHMFAFNRDEDASIPDESTIVIYLAHTPSISTTTIVQNVSTLLDIPGETIHLRFCHWQEYPPLVYSANALRAAFASVPQIKVIRITDEAYHNMIAALRVPDNHTPGLPVPFPFVTELLLDGINFKPGSRATTLLIRMLQQRSSYGAAHPKVRLWDVTNLRVQTVKRLTKIGVEVLWDGDETDAYGHTIRPKKSKI